MQHFLQVISVYSANFPRVTENDRYFHLWKAVTMLQSFLFDKLVHSQGDGQHSLAFSSEASQFSSHHYNLLCVLSKLSAMVQQEHGPEVKPHISAVNLILAIPHNLILYREPFSKTIFFLAKIEINHRSESRKGSCLKRKTRVEMVWGICCGSKMFLFFLMPY